MRGNMPDQLEIGGLDQVEEEYRDARGSNGNSNSRYRASPPFLPGPKRGLPLLTDFSSTAGSINDGIDTLLLESVRVQ